MKVSYILFQLDFFGFKESDFYSKYTVTSMMRLYLFRLIKGFNNYEKLKTYLGEHEEEAFQLGFFKDDKDKLDLPPKRTYNHYLKNNVDKERLTKLAEKILSLSVKSQTVLDIEIVKKSIEKRKKSYDKETKEATRLIKRLVYPNINLKIHHNAKFTKKDLLDTLVHVASQGDFTNNGANTFQTLNPGKKTPSGDVMMHHFSKFKSQDEIKEIFENILNIILKFARRNYNVLKNKKLDVAYDIHDIPYYGKNMLYACNGKPDRGATQFFKFLTCSIVEKGRRFILDVVPISPFDDLDKLMDKSLGKIKNKIKISRVYCDRGFNKINIFRILRKHNLDFLMPMVRTPTVKAHFDKAEHCKSRVFKDFKVGKGENQEKVNLILVDDEDGVKRAFVCNFDIAPQIAYRLYGLYGKRWGIETSYRNLEFDFKPKTTSKNYHIRLFYFLFSCCLYNLWVIVNLCVSLAVYGRIKSKPIITAKLFVILLCRVQEEYFCGDG